MDRYIDLKWEKTYELKSKAFVCWNCGREISSNIGYFSTYKSSGSDSDASIYICHHCHAPNLFNRYGDFVIGTPFGNFVKHLPEEVECVYEEARKCMGIGAYTATIMLLRKILMAVAVLEGAEENKSFKYYLEYLCKERLVHRKQTKQAENVKDLGNDANHKIECRTKQEAEMLFNFVQQFLITNYEFADKEDNE